MLLARAAIVAPLLFLTPVASSGCLGLMCTAILVEDGLRLEVVTAAPLPMDAYTLVVRAEGREVRTAITVDGGGALCGPPCRQELDLGDGRKLIVDPAMSDRGGWLQIGIPGEAGPDVVELELLRGDATVVTTRYEPDYDTEEPNGNGCGEYYVARGTFNIPAL